MSYSKNQILKGEDPNGNLKNIKLSGLQHIEVQDEDIKSLLREIIIQLKINNKHLELLNEVQIQNNNIE